MSAAFLDTSIVIRNVDPESLDAPESAAIPVGTWGSIRAGVGLARESSIRAGPASSVEGGPRRLHYAPLPTDETVAEHYHELATGPSAALVSVAAMRLLRTCRFPIGAPEEEPPGATG